MYQNINSNIVCSVLQLSFGQAINIVNAYIPPNQSITSSDITNILENLNGSTILLNSWSPLWGSPRSNTRGKNIERAIRENNLIVLNDGSPTHLSTHNTFTHIDISLISPQIAHRCSWFISDNLHGSDHFPITIHIATPTNPDNTRPLPKYKTDQLGTLL